MLKYPDVAVGVFKCCNRPFLCWSLYFCLLLDVLFDVLIAFSICFSSFFFLLYFPSMFVIDLFIVAAREHTMVVS